MIELLHIDCMAYMKTIPDKFFELAIVDPPYGIGERLVNGGGGGGWNKQINSGADEWDIKPDPSYFNELFRISKNQIIWGGNFFNLPVCESPICWDKVRPNQKNSSEWEYAWSSFIGRARLFSYCANGGFVAIGNNSRIHPTQKPIKLYKWLLHNWADEGDKIFDSHLGSGSIAIACHDMKFDLIGCEIDKDYYDAAVERFENHKRQLTIF